MELTYNQQRDKTARIKGQKRSKRQAFSLSDLDTCYPQEGWRVSIKIPYSSSSSKNQIYGRPAKGAQNAMYMRKASRDYRMLIALRFKAAFRNSSIKIVTNKLWIEIHVEKPHNKIDAINTVDLICDGIKDAIPLDDKWYCIKKLDWSVNKHDPHILIAISQEDGARESLTCRYCGTITPVNEMDSRSLCFKCRRESSKAGQSRLTIRPYP